MEDKVICRECGKEISRTECFWVGGDCYCEECYYNLTVVCEHCGDRIPYSEARTDDNHTLCQDCYFSYYSVCEDCGAIIANEDCYYEDDYDEYPYCYDCYQRNKQYRTIHDYGYKPDPIFYGKGNRFFGVELEVDNGGQLNENPNTIKYIAEKVEGSFCFTILSKENELYIIKGDNPMCIAQFKDFYIYASTKTILTKALKKLGLKHYKEIPTKDGEILKFDKSGNISITEFDIFPSFYDCPWIYGNRNKKSYKTYEDEYLSDLIYYGKTIGISEELILEMLDSGYDYMDIEDILYNYDYMQGDDYCAEI